jgi:hypothetical protein
MAVTERSVTLGRIKEAAKDREKCWLGFYEASKELSEVASRSQEFNARERKAAIAIELVARLEQGPTKIMRDEFMSQYRILGAPGDFGYWYPEGKALQAVYDWWNCVLQSVK